MDCSGRQGHPPRTGTEAPIKTITYPFQRPRAPMPWPAGATIPEERRSCLQPSEPPFSVNSLSALGK